MRYEVTVQSVASRHIAVVPERRRWSQLGGALIPLLDRVYSAVHAGPYAGLGGAYDALDRWCREHHRVRASAHWEVYGDWHEDPAQLQTEVFYSLVPE